jgi:hypothetical protein
MMLDNCTYDKIKLLHEISSIIWFIEKHALNDAKVSGDASFMQLLQDVDEDLQRHLERLRQTVGVISQ